jgi:hypothetical protein
MSEQLDREGCFLAGLTLVILILVMYMVIDMYVDNRDEHHMRDLQRRVGELEQRVNRQ